MTPTTRRSTTCFMLCVSPNLIGLNFLAPGLRDMHDANNKAVDYLFYALCQSKFDRV
jgi:hypothetical protein